MTEATSTAIESTSVAPPIGAGEDVGLDRRRESPATPGGEPLSRRRRLLLIALLALFALFLLLTGWYLLNRKPITTLPLPGITVENVPHYSFSMYGVDAPMGIAVSPDGGRVYVTQTEGSPAVLILDGGGHIVRTVTPPAAAGSNHVPVYLALDPQSGDLYVSDRPTGSIYVYSADGVYRRTFDPGASLKGWQPLALSFDAKGDLFVTDVSGPYHRVHEFGPDGMLVRTIGSAGEFNYPNGVAVDEAGNIYVADSSNGRLVVFDAAGRQIAVVKRGAAAGDLGMPRGAVVDGDGHVFVVDTTGQGVQVYETLKPGDTTPKYVGHFGTEGTADGAFAFPNGIAVDGRGRVYVADWRNNRVQVWTW